MSFQSAFEVAETRDKPQLRQLLTTDPVAAAYLLGDLVEPFFAHCRWLVASYRGRLEGAVLLYTGLSVPALLSYGAPDAVEAILQQFAAELPATCYAKIPLDHSDFFPRYYRAENTERLWMMGARASELSLPAPRHQSIRLAQGAPLDPINKVYADYPGNWFEPSQLDSGLYFGTYADGQLVSIAGTHVLAPAEGVAVLGNIATVTGARRHGCASACTAGLIDALAALGCETLALQVAIDNSNAIACYRNMGFRFREVVLQSRSSRVS
jgi:ribosomal protein S18 acetylase RimI-like enzyme